MQQQQSASWPGLSRPSTSFFPAASKQDVDARHKAGHDGGAYGWIGLFTCGIWLLGSGTAFSHLGDHSRFSLSEVVSHLVEVDHLVFIALIIGVGALAYRARRRAVQKRSGR